MSTARWPFEEVDNGYLTGGKPIWTIERKRCWALTEKFTLTPSQMTEADVEALREAGLTSGHSLIDTAIAYNYSIPHGGGFDVTPR